MKRKSAPKKQLVAGMRRRKILPAVFVLLSLLLMALPLEGVVSSARAVLAYIFIPQIRAAHGTVEYARGAGETVRELLQTHRENELLRQELRQIRLENAQAREIFKENERLNAALALKMPRRWKGVWAKTAYREPTQWNSVVIDKGFKDGVRERAAAVVEVEGVPALAGVVVEVSDNTAKVLLARDEDFSAVVYTDGAREEGLLSGADAGMLQLRYLPLLSQVQEGEKIYTSASSGIFPAGLWAGVVAQTPQSEGFETALTARVRAAADAGELRELFILTDDGDNR